VRCDVLAVYLAGRDPRVPWYVKALAIGIAAYAFSPIDLIPDFIPVLGQLDDLVLLPLGILLIVKLTPSEIMAECRAAAISALIRQRSMAAACVIIAIWTALAALAGWLSYRWLAA
jgi:uncharacterized membrane protein YkvA (DUF1232 family)